MSWAMCERGDLEKVRGGLKQEKRGQVYICLNSFKFQGGQAADDFLPAGKPTLWVVFDMFSARALI